MAAELDGSLRMHDVRTGGTDVVLRGRSADARGSRSRAQRPSRITVVPATFASSGISWEALRDNGFA